MIANLANVAAPYFAAVYLVCAVVAWRERRTS